MEILYLNRTDRDSLPICLFIMKGDFIMIYTDSNEIALICSECSNVEYSNVSVSVDLDNQSIEPLGFEAKIIARCPKCGSLMNECGVDIATIIQTLQKKHYYVVDSNMCRWQPGELYAPYIKILSGIRKRRRRD